MNEAILDAPKPEVLHLPTIFRRIQNGEIRMPAFQRGFVWLETQILKLLDSVYHGYPLGSVLLWRVEKPILKIEKHPVIPFPEAEERYPLFFVLDGLQRLCTLYGVLHWENLDRPGLFNVLFDLQNECFVHYEDTMKRMPQMVPMSSLSSPKRFLDVQNELLKEAHGESRVDKSVRLYSIFQEYMLPVVTITRSSIPEVVEIFERINNSGMTLSAVDFMRALTWSTDFDLGHEIENIQQVLSAMHFDLSADTIVKVLALVLGYMPTSTEMLQLRELQSSVLMEGVQKARHILLKLVRFVQKEFTIFSSDYIPYEGQILVLVKFLLAGPKPADKKIEVIKRWFWNVGLSEGLRGKPDHYVVRAVQGVDALMQHDVSNALVSHLALSYEDFLERRFIKNKALSAAIAVLFANNSASSLVTGKKIKPETYMEEFSAEKFEGLFNSDQVNTAIGKTVSSPKILANVALVSDEDRSVLRQRGAKAIFENLLTKDDAQEILSSQMISMAAARRALNDDYSGFLKERAKVMLTYAQKVVAPSR